MSQSRIFLCSNNEYFSVMYCFFQSLSIVGSGGAVLCSCSGVIIRLLSCAFLSCGASVYGGAVFTATSNYSSMDKCCGNSCYATYGHFVFLNVVSSGINNAKNIVSQSSAIFCPRNYEGSHETFRTQNGNQTLQNDNSSMNYMTGHSTFCIVTFSEAHMSFCSFCSSKTGTVIMGWQGAKGYLRSLILRNNTYGNVNYGLFILYDGTYESYQIICNNNVFSKSYDIRGTATINTNQIFFNTQTSAPIIVDRFLAGCTILDPITFNHQNKNEKTTYFFFILSVLT